MTHLTWPDRMLDRWRTHSVRTAGKPAQFIASIDDVFPGESRRADELLHGHYRFLGEERIFRGHPPWKVNEASPTWWREVHSFEWFRDFSANDGIAASNKARELCQTWLDSRHNEIAWQPDVLGRRVSSWLTHAGFIMRDADSRFRSNYLASLAFQIRRLEKTAHRGPDGAGRLAAGTGLALSGLALARSERPHTRGLRLIETEARRQVLSDGGHVSRNPSALLYAFTELTRLQAAYRSVGKEIPSFITHALERIAPMLQYLRHGDGRLVLFNGASEESSGTITTLLQSSKTDEGLQVPSASTGYQQLKAKRLIMCVDTGAPPPGPFDKDAHAGAASFEVSVGQERLVVNCGAAPNHQQDWWTACRATAAHSALIVNDTNTVGLTPDGGVHRRAVPVRARRYDSGEGLALEIHHDGYLKTFDIRHTRTIAVASDGTGIEGEDRLTGGRSKPFAVRFHLHPSTNVSLIQEGSAALLRLADGSGWIFIAKGGRLSIESSIYLGVRGEARRTEQLVINDTHSGGESWISWRFYLSGQEHQE